MQKQPSVIDCQNSKVKALHTVLPFFYPVNLPKKKCSVASVVTGYKLNSLYVTHDHFRVMSYDATSRPQSYLNITDHP